MLIGSDKVQLLCSLDILTSLEVFHRPIFYPRISRVVHIKGSHLSRICSVELPQHRLRVFHLYPVFLHQSLGCNDIFFEGLEDFLDDSDKVRLDLFELIGKFFMLVEGALGRADDDKFISDLINWL